MNSSISLKKVEENPAETEETKTAAKKEEAPKNPKKPENPEKAPKNLEEPEEDRLILY